MSDFNEFRKSLAEMKAAFARLETAESQAQYRALMEDVLDSMARTSAEYEARHEKKEPGEKGVTP